MNRIIVVGSASMDLVVETDTIPEQGQTVLGTSFVTTPGGKDANQAVAAAKLGGEVYMIGAVGDDDFGQEIIANFNHHGVDTSLIDVIENAHSGTAHITLFDNDNRIIVVPAANHHVTPDSVLPKLERFEAGDVLLIQQEIPSETVEAVIRFASEKDFKVILNPAPFRELPRELIEKVTYLTPNENEHDQLFCDAQSITLKQLPRKLIVTRGDEGAVYWDYSLKVIPAYDVNVVDTTGAGDTFNSALAVALTENKTLEQAIRFSNVAAGYAVTAVGAQSGMPEREVVDEALSKLE
ncbi:ribokinase [Staphylococcus massiliensis]|uniref:ribokinase n=1 Tax=Staphylococcus massiliensis TaxID=555791 RepID=UPI001EDFE752|nr:ribokinase [Staphylococcus massiliensis]MCG3402770.1 ribokinase [Staphylococcus massiliensis]